MALVLFVQVKLEDFKVIHIEFIMLLCLVDHKNKKTENACTFGYSERFSKKLGSL